MKLACRSVLLAYSTPVRMVSLIARAVAASLVVQLLPASAPAVAQVMRPGVAAGEAGSPPGTTDAPRPDTIVVTGAAVPVAWERIGNTLTVIPGDTLATKHVAYLQDALREVPGVAVTQGGSFGALTQVRVRGAEANHVLVLVDGVEVAPVGSGEFDFSSLPADAIDRVEILRGPQSGLYGSNALAGVINVITRGGERPGFDAAAEYGTFHTLFGRAGATLGDRETFLSANAIYRETDGFSSAAVGTEADGDRNLTLYLRSGVTVSDIARIDGSLRYVDRRSDTDGFDFSGGPLQGMAVDDDSHARTEDWSGRVELAVEPGERWHNALSAAYSRSDGTGSAAGTDSFGDSGKRLKLAARSSHAFGNETARHTLTVFVEHEWESYRNTLPFDPSQEAWQERTMLGYGAEYRLDLGDAVFLRAAVRHDDNDAFADPTTYSLAGSWAIRPSGTRFHASYGTGVTNPTFFEQFGLVPGQFVGNPALRPEQATGFDFGAEQRLFGDTLVLDATYFAATLEDEIVNLFPSVANDFGESAREGLELTARIDLGAVTVGGSYTYLDTDDPDGTAEVQRPKHQASFNIGGRFGPGGRGTFNLAAIYNGRMVGTDFRNYFTNGFVAEKSPLDPYTVVRLAGAYRLANGLELFGRLENAFDARYQQVISYAAARRAVYAGLRFTLRSFP